MDKQGSEMEDSPVVLKDGITINNTPEGTGNTFGDLGGYIVEYTRNEKQARKQNYLYEPDLTTPNYVNIYFTFVLYNRNGNYFSLHVVNFRKTPAGEVIPLYETHVTRMFYDGSLEYFRLFLEIIFLIIFSYFLFVLVKTIFFIFLGKIRDQLEKQEANMKLNSLIFRLIGFDRRKNLKKD